MDEVVAQPQPSRKRGIANVMIAFCDQRGCSAPRPAGSRRWSGVLDLARHRRMQAQAVDAALVGV
ncbi:hypothetical protein, partial [Escherichia coli]|uniref:hypothetical protein n=1 Tax=Escherichia coli TaxID=562 RepID=UPI003CE4DCCF